jgi:S-adenosylmethionine hydrolase
MLETPIITLTTDFGLKDPFAGVMKGIILGINPDAKVIDITHNIQRHNIFEASQVIAMSYKYFPSTTIHIAVVDPGVGGMRRPIMVSTGDHYFIGPDNGILTQVIEEQASHFIEVIHLTSSQYFLPVIGSTFHGRDIFSPVAAWLSKGVDPRGFGEQIDDYIRIDVPKSVITNESTITGEIVSIDNFGNAKSNIKKDDMAKLASVKSKDKFNIVFNNEQIPLVNYYAENESPGLSAIINSFEHIELFVYKDSAAEKFDIKTGDSVTLTVAD